ncbi:MAG: exo-alpha-sialidase, partial [bacterium]|nr:exo-alpha-sialidase [bacterium]
MKTSEDNGASWSRTRILNPDRGALPSQPIGSAYCTDDGRLIVPSDWSESGMEGGASALWISEDRGETWTVPKGFIAGIHAGVVDLGPKKFVALGRSSAAETMPRSTTKDGGESWKYSRTDLPGLGGGRRCVLRSLKEGPLLLVDQNLHQARATRHQSRGADLGRVGKQGRGVVCALAHAHQAERCRHIELGY